MPANSKEYAKTWYDTNKERVLAEKRHRYATDPVFRERSQSPRRNTAGHIMHPSKLLTYQEYRVLVGKQEGLCKICCSFVGLLRGVGRGNNSLVVDHEHKTTKVRGLLCGNCNTAIGLLQDSPEICEKTGQYLRETKQIQAPMQEVSEGMV